ncbi:MAG: hypothetical protein HQ539_02735 [Parcubacteria group bacterium]|nr:hypothetical protein [Parcubacteria group bacterium]
MQFQVPKFLEREATIAFGLTFKKLAVAGGLGLILFVLKYMMPQWLWVTSIIFIGGSFAALSFVKIGGHSLYSLILNSFWFFSAPRTYVWKQKQGASPMKLVKKEVEQKKKQQDPLQVSPQSRLGGLKSKIDLGEPGE